ncbi:hypothetical protein FDH97_gp105 [Erwinia phage vB_EamM_Deimos-Minion]|uniref:Uncharacterized protein n=1 Tax=Erwinia phage vB_EamM_Deimos-Minion TaxID=1815986 RepID=A0A173GF34_9CAUD|nr:hypothetical protein FDH97_gp105 [Erwinia phage vB_EamM_Deimos-Minion]ANH52203.1 hypothetical protein DM_105 [Erwinia phage vB_EamM_Deimos-Minion]
MTTAIKLPWLLRLLQEPSVHPTTWETKSMLPKSEPISIFSVSSVQLTETSEAHFRKELNEADAIHSVYAFKDGSQFGARFNGFLVITGPILAYQLFRGSELESSEFVGTFMYGEGGEAIIPENVKTVFSQYDRNRVTQFKALAQALHSAVTDHIKGVRRD